MSRPRSKSSRNESRGQQGQQQEEEGSGMGTLFAVVGISAALAGTYILGRSHSTSSPSPSPVHVHSTNRSSTSSRAPPVRRFTDAEEADAGSGSGPSNPSRQCSICFIDFEFISSRGEHIHTTPCGHVFCYYCIYNSLQRSERCPICRNAVRPTETTRIHFY